MDTKTTQFPYTKIKNLMRLFLLINTTNYSHICTRLNPRLHPPPVFYGEKRCHLVEGPWDKKAL
jgi:hypothetical protein